MSDTYLHGAYGDINANGNRVSTEAASGAMIVVGTAPVHTLEGGADNVNVPKVVRSIAEAKRLFGYSDDWAKYTLCEAIHHFFETMGIGPLVLINVLDPATHRASTQGSASLTPVNNRITIANAQEIILDSVVVKTQDETPVTKEKGTDYTIAYNSDKQTITIVGITDLGTSALTVTYNSVDPALVTDSVVAGSSDGEGTNTGVYAVKNVYPLTGYVPSYLLAPGFSSHPTVHAAMYANSHKVNGHWDLWMFVDLPLMNGQTPLTMATIAAYKAANNFNHENETVYFPMATGTDGKKYHLSTLAAANFLALLGDNLGLPYHSASNTAAPIIEALYLGEAGAGKVYDDEIINEKLNKNGIASACFVGGRWAIWGAHAADYTPDSADTVNVAETNRMMLYYISNDFQVRRPRNVDQPMTANDISSMIAEEQSRLDALKNSGVILFGEVSISSDPLEESDVFSGDYVFEFRVTTTPLAKSLKAIVTWVDDGFAVYFAGESDVG